MALFNLGNKNSKKQTPSCNCGCPTAEATNITNSCCGETTNDICSIKVLGAGCASCHQQYEYVKEAVQNMGLSVEVAYITDMAKIMEYGVMSMPALIVNEKVVAMGKILKVADVEKLLR